MLLYYLVLLMRQIGVWKRLKLDIFTKQIMIAIAMHLASSWKLHMCDVIVPISDRGWNNHELDSFPENNNLL